MLGKKKKTLDRPTISDDEVTPVPGAPPDEPGPYEHTHREIELLRARGGYVSDPERIAIAKLALNDIAAGDGDEAQLATDALGIIE